jgi:hypothetical protein
VADEQRPFEDVRETAESVSIPELKWRELLFVGALRREGDVFVRDPSRPLLPFKVPDLFPVGVFLLATSDDGRVTVRRKS